MSDVTDDFFTDDSQEWISTLPAFQQKSINALIAQGISLEDIAIQWVSASAATTAPFSAGAPAPSGKDFLEKLKLEIRAFICGDKKYEKDREEISKAKQSLQLAFVTSVSAAVAPHIGANATVILPIAALVLANIGKISKNAWCST
jgi:hypothetical protein